jgi:hypothetical protein
MESRRWRGGDGEEEFERVEGRESRGVDKRGGE